VTNLGTGAQRNRRTQDPPQKSRVQMTVETLGVFVLLAAFVGYYTYVGGGILREWITWYRLDQASATVEGQAIHRVAGPKGTHTVTYRYQAPGPGGAPVVYTREQDVSNDYYAALAARAPGDLAQNPATVRVRYVPSDPSLSNLEGNDRAGALLLGTPVVLCILGFGYPVLALLLFGLLPWRRGRRVP
jgi:hypothetical protein